MRSALLSICLLGSALLQAQPGPAARNEAPVEVPWNKLLPLWRPKVLPLPPLARVTGVGGFVSVRVLVGRTGTVERAEALDGPALLRPVAEAWCRAWTFKPVLVNGQAVPAMSEVRTDFSRAEAAGGLSAPTGTLLEVVQPLPAAMTQADLESVRMVALRSLAALGLPVVSRGQADTTRILAVRIEVQSSRSPDGLCFFQVKGQAGPLSAWSSFPGTPTNAEATCGFARLFLLPEEARLPEALSQVVQESLSGLAEPAIPSEAVPGSPAQVAPVPEVPGIMRIDFSRVRIKLRPPPPHYPQDALARRIQGTVHLDLTVDPTGVPVRIEALGGPRELLSTAMRYALQWRFEPFRLDREPREVRFYLLMPFELG